MFKKEIELIEIGIVFFFSFVLTFLLFYVFKGVLTSSKVSIIFSQSLSFLFVCLIYSKLKFRLNLKQILFSRILLSDIKYSFKILGYYLFTSAVFVSLYYLLFISHNTFSQPVFEVQGLPLKERMVYFLTLILIGPIAEETFSRRIIYSFLRQYFSVNPSIVVSAVLFAFMHSGGIKFIDVFVAGCFLAYSYEKKKTLFVPILIHSLINLFGFIFGILLISS